jgi:hypothetical protein
LTVAIARIRRWRLPTLLARCKACFRTVCAAFVKLWYAARCGEFDAVVI